MIVKELDPFHSEDKFAKSGRAAEEQMAFYLKRFFGNDPDILVLNGIRLEADGDAAQVDHLLICPHGLVIVESKSVIGKIQIKDDGQWIRWFNGNQSKGMPSPLTQARLQERFFRSLLGRASTNPAAFESLPIDLYVAISDSGVIVWPKAGVVEGVCKADQVADKVLQRLAAAKATATGNLLPAANRDKIAQFLIARHQPLIAAEPRTEIQELPPSVIPPEIDATPAAIATPEKLMADQATEGDLACKHCDGTDVEIRYAYSYFLYCRACEKNTPIKMHCPACQALAKLRKQKKEFYVECEPCKYSALYFVNP